MGLRPSSLPVPVLLLAMAAAAMALPAAHAVLIGQHDIGRPFFYGGLVLAVLVAMLWLAVSGHVGARDHADAPLRGFVAAYLVLPPALAWPFWEAVGDTSFLNAWFEMVSCFTTTGATLYPDAGRLPDSLHLWRGIVGWLGGFHILVMAMAVLKPRNLGGAEVLSGAVGRAERAGNPGDAGLGRLMSPGERITREAALVFPVYGAATLILWAGLALSGESALAALLRAMATLSTSGILVPMPALGGPDGMAVAASATGFLPELLVAFGMLLGLSRRILPAAGRPTIATPREALREAEMRLGLTFLAIAAFMLWFRYLAARVDLGAGLDLTEVLRAAWAALFSSLSLLTTTGFVARDWQLLVPSGGPEVSELGLMLMGLAIVGGGVATTAGGVKLLRMAALIRHGEGEMKRALHPSVVTGGRARLAQSGAWVSWVFFVLFATAILIGLMALTAEGESVETALSFSIAALTTTGPLADLLLPPGQSWPVLSSSAKALLAGLMVVGRIEVLALLVVLNPESWRRG